jgi:propionate CoA-transferase
MSKAIDSKLCTADTAVSHIASGSTIACGGFIGSAHPEALTCALEERFQRDNTPRDLTLVYGAGQGDGKQRGLNHLAHSGLLKRVIGGHWGLAPSLGRLANENKIEAYNFPQGVLCQLFRDIAAGRPGCITHVGLGTFMDPLHNGGRLNARTTEELVERVELGGRIYLWYKSFPIHVGLIRASAADIHGGLLFDEEAILGEALAIAQAAHNHGGIVIAQVKRILNQPAPPHLVRVPGILVDHIVVANQTLHPLTFAEEDNFAYYTAAAIDSQNDTNDSNAARKLLSDERFIIASRACDELLPGSIANLGIGMPEGISVIAKQRGLLAQCTLTIESGPIGGAPAGGLSFGASAHPHAIIDQPAQFDFYDGGGLDFAALGAAQIDPHGNVNVSKFGARIAGVGGFANIAHNAKKLVFCGSFTANGLNVACSNDRLSILQEGQTQKFVQSIEQICYAAQFSNPNQMEVLYVTERAVFRKCDSGLELIEIAPGIDLKRDVLAHMAFLPIIKAVRLMPTEYFRNREPQ